MTVSDRWNERYLSGTAHWDASEPCAELRRLLDEGLLQPCRVLELGCGTGVNAIFLSQRGFSVTALDVAPRAIEVAIAKAQHVGAEVRFLAADVLAPPAIGEPFPLVFDRGLYHFLRRGSLNGFLDVLARFSEAGGSYLTLALNANDRERLGEPAGVRADEICRELESLFDVVQLRECRFEAAQARKAPPPLGWSALLRRRAGA